MKFTGRRIAVIPSLFTEEPIKGNILEDWYDEDTNDRYFRVLFDLTLKEAVFSEKGFWKNLGLIS